jgi:hypothetical protein
MRFEPGRLSPNLLIKFDKIKQKISRNIVYEERLGEIIFLF